MSSSAEQNNWLSDLRCYQAIKNSLAGRHDHIAKAYQQQWPNFIIIGSAKSATTTLATVLGRHPEIQISQSMKPKFFGRNYRRRWEWYGQQFSGAKRNATACLGKQARCTPPLTARINTHHNSSAIISASFH